MNRKSIRVSKSKDASPVSGRADKLADGASNRDVTLSYTHITQCIKEIQVAYCERYF